MSSKNLIKSPSGRKLDEMIALHLTLIKYKGIGFYVMLVYNYELKFHSKTNN